MVDVVNVGTAANSGDGDTLRGAFLKTNAKFVEMMALALYNGLLYTNRGAWVTLTVYAVNDLAAQGGVIYCSQVAHTAGVFATDLAAGKWTIHQGVTSFDLADTSSTAKGGGMVGYLGTLNYAAGTLGYRAKLSVNLLDFCAAADSENIRLGVTASNTCMAAAATAAYLRNNCTINVPCGIYRKTGPYTFTQGVMVMCEGSQGSNQAYGTTFVDYHTGHGFVWDGSGTSFTGTGGGLQNALIVKADTYQGGDAIKVIATDDNHRPGEMLFSNILVYGVGSTPGPGGNGGLWDRGLHVNGSACYVPGGRGVRHVHSLKCRFADSMVPNETVLLHNVTHFFGSGLSIDTGDSSSAAGLTIKGISDGIFLQNSDIAGTVIVHQNGINVGGTTFVTGTNYAAGSYCISVGGRVYKTTAGGIAGATAPTGTGTGISDGTVLWDYVQPMTAEDGSTGASNCLPHAHQPGLTYSANSYCYSDSGKVYKTTAGGTAGATAPTGTGTVSDGTVSWVYQCPIASVSFCRNLHISGKVGGVLQQADTQVDGVISCSYGTTGALPSNCSPNIDMLGNRVPSFRLTNAAADLNVTGNGAVYDVVFDTEGYDYGGNVVVPANTFNCSVAGRYHFAAGVTVTQLTAAMTRMDLSIMQTGSVTKVATAISNPYAGQGLGGPAQYYTGLIAGYFDLKYGDVVKVRCAISNGAGDTADIHGDATTDYTWFSGEYVA